MATELTIFIHFTHHTTPSSDDTPANISGNSIGVAAQKHKSPFLIKMSDKAMQHSLVEVAHKKCSISKADFCSST